MALNKQVVRLSKLLVDRDGITFAEAQKRLLGLTLEVHVGEDSVSPAAHAAALTAVSVARRTFIGGVRVTGALDQPLLSPLGRSRTLGGALSGVGASDFDSEPAQRILVGGGAPAGTRFAARAWWNGWCAGIRRGEGGASGVSDNPLAGLAAGAAAVGAAFQELRGPWAEPADIELWAGGPEPEPSFSDMFLPSDLWLVGLGNLGQAYLWALGTLPYEDPSDLSVMLQDYDRVGEENWATSVIVTDEAYGALKTKVAEQWAEERGFTTRRIDRALTGYDRVGDGEPLLCLSGLDKVAPRRLLARTGFDCIIDAGLGRGADDFERYRVNVFDEPEAMERHFAGLSDPEAPARPPSEPAYDEIAVEVGRCGATEIANASVAAPYVSAIAGAVAIARAVALASGCECPVSDVRRVSARQTRTGPCRHFQARGIGNAGRPRRLQPG